MHTKVEPVHGTYAGYQRHTRDKTPHCEECKAAAAERMAERRANPDKRKRDHEVSLAGGRAAWRLVAAHRDEYDRYYAEALSAIRGVR